MSISQLSISYLQVVSAATQERGISKYNDDCLGESAGGRDGTIHNVSNSSAKTKRENWQVRKTYAKEANT